MVSEVFVILVSCIVEEEDAVDRITSDVEGFVCRYCRGDPTESAVSHEENRQA
jgi:hypothetical protein